MFLGHMSNLMVHYNIQLPIHYSCRIHLHCTAITTLMCQGIMVTKRTRRKHNIPQAQMLSYQFWKCVIITMHTTYMDVARCTIIQCTYHILCAACERVYVRKVCTQFQREEVFCSPSRKSTSAYWT